MKNDITILIQGKFDYECFNYIIRNYYNTPVIFSYWENDFDIFNKIKSFYKNSPTGYIPDPELSNIKTIFNTIPEYKGPVNFNLQCISTLSGLEQVETDLVVKVRGDEYYSNLGSIVPIISNNRKIYSSPLFFRSMKHWTLKDKYHIGDHLLAGHKDDLQIMYQKAQSKMFQDDFYHGERGITISYLEHKGFTDLENLEEGRKYMIDNFDILNLEHLKPYKMVANGIDRVWYNNYSVLWDFTQHQALFNCIDKIEDL